jgi:hypothetical protein
MALLFLIAALSPWPLFQQLGNLCADLKSHSAPAAICLPSQSLHAQRRGLQFQKA